MLDTMKRKTPLRFSVLLLGAASVFAALVLSSFAAQAQETLRIAAVVNEEIISAYDHQSRVRLIVALSRLPQVPDTYQKLAPETLRALIDEKLKLQEAERVGISVSDQDIDYAFSVVEQRTNLQPGQLPTFIDANGLNMETLITQLRANLLWPRIIGKKYRSNFEISEEEIDAGVAEAEAAREQPQYLLSEMLIALDNPSQQQEIEQQVLRMSADLVAGADFASLARSFSRAPSATNGGDLGWMRADQLPPEIAAIVATLAPGQISQPIRVPNAYVILQLRERRSGGQVPQADQTVRLSQVHLALPGDAPDQTVATYIQTLRDKTQALRDCETFDAAGREIGSPLSGALGKIPLKNLPPNLANAVRDLPVGQASAPIRTNDAVLALMVCEREKAPAAPDTASREQVRGQLLSKRMENYARQYLRDLRRAAYIEIR